MKDTNGLYVRLGMSESKAYGVNVGNDSILCVGSPGSGKTNLINYVVSSIVESYMPSDVDLRFVDFKDSEFGRVYADKHTGASLIPHASLIVGNKSGAYGDKVLWELLQQLRSRAYLFVSEGVCNFDQYNTLNPENKLPRIVMVMDEFQVMFKSSPVRAADLLYSILQIAGPCGCNIIFASQSLDSSVPAELLEKFKVRIALKCPAKVSNLVIGTSIASTLTGSDCAYVVVGDTSIRVEVPYVDGSELDFLFNCIRARCAAEGEVDRKAIYFGR